MDKMNRVLDGTTDDRQREIIRRCMEQLDKA